MSLAAGIALAAGGGPWWARPVAAQETLQQAAAGARQEWLTHDVAGLVAGSDTVRLQVPGVPQSASLEAAQVARLLSRYLGATRETAFDLVAVRPTGGDEGYAEGRRHNVGQGTAEVREETVFLGFERRGGRWCLREIRVVQ